MTQQPEREGAAHSRRPENSASRRQDGQGPWDEQEPWDELDQGGAQGPSDESLAMLLSQGLTEDPESDASEQGASEQGDDWGVWDAELDAAELDAAELDAAELDAAELDTAELDTALDSAAWDSPAETVSAPIDAEKLQETLARWDQAAAAAPSSSAAPLAASSSAASPPQGGTAALDPVLLEAFADDAANCLAGLESASLALESATQRDAAELQIRRDLHTLKGASASVGWSELAERIHRVEELLRHSPPARELQRQLDAVADHVATQLRGESPTSESPTSELPNSALPNSALPNSALPNSASPTGESSTSASSTSESSTGASSTSASSTSESPASESPTGAEAVLCESQSPRRDAAPGPSPPSRTSSWPATSPATSAATAALTGAQPGTQRVRSAQLDRLIDMLAELVMLRNRRQSTGDQLSRVHGELTQSVEQLRRQASRAGERFADDDAARVSLLEVADDFADSLRSLREFYESLAVDTDAVSDFIGQFRHEVASLRRMPVSNLFQRLQRVVRDAARLEGKQARLEWRGGEVGLEPSLQERLFEPLLHITRNAVSHGIELPQVRAAAGKGEEGVIVLEASSSGNLLQLEIRDDGRGLDYDAIRRRGIQCGLLPAGRPAGEQELAQLIFHPGFSTREQATELAGRGVGMDVAAATLDQLRGWVDVRSTAGQGTVFSITLPLPSVIQHVMLFRAGGQLFGLPMQCLQLAGGLEPRGAAGPTPATCAARAADVLGWPQASGGNDRDARLLWLQMPSFAAESKGGEEGEPASQPLSVEQIVGPEEVVVRPLPPLLQEHPLFAGSTLSGDGEVVLLMEPTALRKRMQQLHAAAAAGEAATDLPEARGAAAATPPQAVLVVDDSRTSRLRITRPLAAALPVEIYEASNGLQALQALQEREFALVFTDLEMPGLDGFELLTEIRSQGAWDRLPVVVVSSLQGAEQQRRTLQLGASAHLGKPALDAAVVQVARQLLEQSAECLC